MTAANFDQIDSLVFDLDGTLWDASAACSKAWNAALRQIGSTHVVDEELIRSLSGLPIEKVLDRGFRFVGDQDRKTFLEYYRAYEKEFMRVSGGSLYPHTKEVLTELSSQYKLFVVSNCLSGYIENFIEFHGLHHLFADFECSGRTGLSKAENIQEIMERNRLTSSVYIGDTIWDYEAAQKANVPFVYAAYGFGSIDNAPLKIQNMAELRQMFNYMHKKPAS